MLLKLASGVSGGGGGELMVGLFGAVSQKVIRKLTSKTTMPIIQLLVTLGVLYRSASKARPLLYGDATTVNAVHSQKVRMPTASQRWTYESVSHPLVYFLQLNFSSELVL